MQRLPLKTAYEAVVRGRWYSIQYHLSCFRPVYQAQLMQLERRWNPEHGNSVSWIGAEDASGLTTGSRARVPYRPVAGRVRATPARSGSCSSSDVTGSSSSPASHTPGGAVQPVLGKRTASG